MSKPTQHRTAGGFIVLSGADRAAAAKDRSTWLNWQPSRDYQLAQALINAVLAYPGVHPITKRVSQNVR